MEEINSKIGKNLLTLRKKAKLTQMELAEKFNYSDKSISKWENGESLPSIEVLNELAKFYGVSLDSLINSNEEFEEIKPEKPQKQPKPKMFPTKLIVTLLSVSAVWFLATLAFVLVKLFLNINYGICFLWAIPASCIVLIVFNSLWGHYRYFFPILTVLLWSLIMCLHLQIWPIGINIWPIYILGIPLQVTIILWGALVKKPKGYLKKQKMEQKLKEQEEKEEA